MNFADAPRFPVVRFLARRRRANAKRLEKVRASIAQSDAAAVAVPAAPSPRLLEHVRKTRAKAAPVPGPNAEARARKRFEDARRASLRPGSGRLLPFGMGALALALLATANAPHKRDGALVE